MSRMNGLSFWGPGKAFSPTNIVNLSAWYDPSDLSTLWQDTGATTPAGVGDAVARMDDKSGNGRHATQATSGSRPVLRQDAGGRYYLEPDGSDDYMEVPVAAIDYTGSISVWTGYALDDANSDSTPQLFGGTSSTGFNIWHLSGTGKPRLFTTEDGTASTNSLDYQTPLTDNEAIVRGDVHSDSAGKAMRIAGQDVVSNSTAYAALDEPSACYLFGDASSQNLAGAFYGMAIYNGLLTDAEKTSIDRYYADKIGDTGMAKLLEQNMLDFFAADTRYDVTDDFSSYADTAALLEVYDDISTGDGSATLGTDVVDLDPGTTGRGVIERKFSGLTVGKRYTFGITVDGGAPSNCTLRAGTTSGDNDLVSSVTAVAGATTTASFIATTDTAFVFIRSNTVSGTYTIDDFTFEGTATTGAMWDFTDFDAMTGNDSVLGVSASDAILRVLDKSRGLSLSANSVTNGGFDTDTDWTTTGAASISGGTASLPNNGNTLYQDSVVSGTAGKLYKITYTQISDTGPIIYCGVNSSSNGLYAVNHGSLGPGTRSVYLFSGGAHTEIRFGVGVAGPAEIDDVSVQEVSGIHLGQTTSGSRPVAANDADGNSLDFDGSDDYLTALDPDDDLAISGDLVIAVVAKADNDANVKTIMAAGDSTIATDTAYQMFMDGSEQVGLEQADATNSEAETTTLAASATTSLLELQRDGASVDFWKDEDSTEAETFATVTSPTAGTTIETLVGVHVDESSEPFAGSIQAVFVANRIWTLTEHVRLRAYFQSLTEADVT